MFLSRYKNTAVKLTMGLVPKSGDRDSIPLRYQQPNQYQHCSQIEHTAMEYRIGQRTLLTGFRNVGDSVLNLLMRVEWRPALTEYES
jgi:hypothetical protein